MKNNIVLLVIALLLSGCKDKSNDNLVKVYYVPFSNIFYVHVTIADIEERAPYYLESREPNVYKTVSDLLIEGKGVCVFNEQGVRAKIMLGDKIFYVDDKGCVLSKDHHYLVEPTAFEKTIISLAKKRVKN